MKQTDISARKKVGAPIWNPRPFNYYLDFTTIFR